VLTPHALIHSLISASIHRNAGINIASRVHATRRPSTPSAQTAHICVFKQHNISIKAISRDWNTFIMFDELFSVRPIQKQSYSNWIITNSHPLA
jgi:hypothetical protein